MDSIATPPHWLTIVDPIRYWAALDASRIALADAQASLDYRQLGAMIDRSATALARHAIRPGDRVGVIAEKSLAQVVAIFACIEIGAIAVPINPALKPAQLEHVLSDSGAALLIHVAGSPPPVRTGMATLDGDQLCEQAAGSPAPPRAGATDHAPALIFYTSGSTGKPKGVVVSQRNLLAGALSVASYLRNDARDRLLAALPLSFDAGFSQLSTAFCAGAFVQMHRYWLPQDCLRAMALARVSGLTAVPPMWHQLAAVRGFDDAWRGLRYFANTGGAMPRTLLGALRERAPQAQPFLMYGLTEAFRSSYLDPSQVDARPDSIGQAIPNAELFVLRDDGTPCGPDEPGELVHRGATVALGYWGDPELTARKFRPLPAELAPVPGERAVWSGDLVKRDADGFLYYVGRRDEQIKTSGYRVSPTEVEEVLYASRLVDECVVFGVPDATLGQAIVAVVKPAEASMPRADQPLPDQLRAHCRQALPAYMVPKSISLHAQALPRGANGKFDRMTIASQWRDRGQSSSMQ